MKLNPFCGGLSFYEIRLIVSELMMLLIFKGRIQNSEIEEKKLSHAMTEKRKDKHTYLILRYKRLHTPVIL